MPETYAGGSGSSDASTAHLEDMHVQLGVQVFDSAEEANASDVPVRIVAPGLTGGCTPIPVGCTGMSVAGIELFAGDAMRWVRYFPETDTLETSIGMPLGDFDVHTLSATVTADGAVYAEARPRRSNAFTIDEGFASREQPALATLELVRVPPELVSDAMLELVAVQASSDQNHQDLAQANIDAARVLRNGAEARELTERERAALDFVAAFLSSIGVDGSNPDGSARLINCDPQVWFTSWISYLAEDTECYEYCMGEYGRALDWDERVDGPYWGERNLSSVFDAAAILSSEGDVVRVAVRGWEDNNNLPIDFRESMQPDFFVVAVTFNDANEVVDFQNGVSWYE